MDDAVRVYLGSKENTENSSYRSPGNLKYLVQNVVVKSVCSRPKQAIEVVNLSIPRVDGPPKEIVGAKLSDKASDFGRFCCCKRKVGDRVIVFLTLKFMISLHFNKDYHQSIKVPIYVNFVLKKL